MKLRFLALSGMIILSAVAPVIGLFVCAAILAIQIVLIGLRPVFACLPARDIAGPQTVAVPRFSVHVATHSEPAELVIRTLDALLDQDWPADGYEIIVMDNNTTDRALWMPVAAFCRAHPDRLRFLHQSGVQGAKAGALNIALAHTPTRITHIVTVDADYIVHRNFLSLAAEALQRTGADYVQFPQSYASTATTAPGIDAELEEYFRTNAAVADEAEAVLLTGTLCVISKTALIAVGGWSGATTTEDAELGVRLCNAGFAGRFINQIVGQGLLPLTLGDLEKQRYRWCSGNADTLLKHAPTLLVPTKAFNLRKRLVVISQLTAWTNLSLVPCGLLMVWLITGQGHAPAAKLAAAVITVSLCDISMRVIVRGLRDKLTLAVVCHALACRIALAPQSARATFDALMGTRLPFIVTDKSGGKRPNAGPLRPCTVLLCILAVLMLIGTQTTNPLIIAALFILMLPLPATLVTHRSLRAYRAAVVAPFTEVAA